MDVLVTTGLLAVFVSGWLLTIKYVIESRIYARLLVWSTGKALPTIEPPVLEFIYPRVEHDEKFDLRCTQPLPYRPFRWGPNYHITMGLRQGDWNEWIELDSRFPKYHAIKSARIKDRGDRCVKSLPARPGVGSGQEPANEAVRELVEYLSRRYPQVYQVKRHPPTNNDIYSWDGDGEIASVTINPLGVTYNLGQEDPMTVAGLLLQDDLAIMVPGADGKHYLQAGSICLAGSWRLEDKIGLPLAAIHTAGGVPQYENKLQSSMDRFFSKLQPDKLVMRNNYFFQVVDNPSTSPFNHVDPEELHWAYSALGDEDAFIQGDHHTLASQPEISFGPPIRPEQIFFRSERQSLRRLPRTGAVLFTIRTYYEPVTKLAAEPGVPGRMASALRSWPEDVALYKGQARYKDILLEYLDWRHAMQVEAGTDKTSTAKYPF